MRALAAALRRRKGGPAIVPPPTTSLAPAFQLLPPARPHSTLDAASPQPVTSHAYCAPPAVRVTPLQRLLVGVGAAVAGFVDPARGDMIALLGELTGEVALQRLVTRMRATAEGRRLLEEKPRIRSSALDVTALNALPDDTFGGAYAAYLRVHGFHPDERAEVRCIEDADLRYVMQRYREVHDFWHVLSGLPPSVMGEVALKWLEFLHTGLPLPMLSALIGPARLSPQDQATMARVYIPWATRVSTQSVCLLSVRYESLFAKPLAQVRAELNFEPAPQLPYATHAPVHAATPDASAPGAQPSNVRRRVTIL